MHLPCFLYIDYKNYQINENYITRSLKSTPYAIVHTFSQEEFSRDVRDKVFDFLIIGCNFLTEKGNDLYTKPLCMMSWEKIWTMVLVLPFFTAYRYDQLRS